MLWCYVQSSGADLNAVVVDSFLSAYMMLQGHTCCVQCLDTVLCVFMPCCCQTVDLCTGGGAIAGGLAYAYRC